MNSSSMELLDQDDDSGMDFTGTLPDYDICHINNTQQTAHTKKPYKRRSGLWSLHTPTSWGPSSLQYRRAMCTSTRVSTISPG